MPAFNKIGDTFKSFSVIDRVVIVFLILWMLLVAIMGEWTDYNILLFQFCMSMLYAGLAIIWLLLAISVIYALGWKSIILSPVFVIGCYIFGFNSVFWGYHSGESIENYTRVFAPFFYTTPLIVIAIIIFLIIYFEKPSQSFQKKCFSFLKILFLIAMGYLCFSLCLRYSEESLEQKSRIVLIRVVYGMPDNFIPISKGKSSKYGDKNVKEFKFVRKGETRANARQIFHVNISRQGFIMNIDIKNNQQ